MKKPLIALALFLVAATALTAQPTFRWGLNLYPNITNRRLVVLTNITQPAIDSIEKREVSRPSWSAGFTAGWRGKKLGFHTGINYMDAGYRTMKEDTPEADPNLPLGRQRRFAFQNSYLEVPAEVNFYQSLGERSAFYFMLGTAISINTTNRYDTFYYSSERGHQYQPASRLRLFPHRQWRLPDRQYGLGIRLQRTLHDGAHPYV